MIKDIYKFARKALTAALVGMVLLIPSACSNDTVLEENNGSGSEGDAVEFTVMLPNGATGMQRQQSTRAFTTLDNRWTINEEMAICEGSTVYKYKPIVSGGSGERVALEPSPSLSSNCYYWSTLVPTRTFTAWYPYSSTKPTSVTGATDQRSDTYFLTGNQGSMTDATYNLLDLLYAPDVTVGFKQSVNLEFYHQMCRIIVTVNSSGTKGSKPVTAITFGKNNIAAGGTVTPGYTGASSTATASWSVTKNTSVQMRLTNAIAAIKQYTYECIVPPQALAASEVLFQITTYNQNDNVHPTKTTNFIPQNLYQDAPDFKAGYQYNYMLTLSREGLVNISTVQVNDWATENVNNLTATVPDAGY